MATDILVRSEESLGKYWNYSEFSFLFSSLNVMQHMIVILWLHHFLHTSNEENILTIKVWHHIFYSTDTIQYVPTDTKILLFPLLSVAFHFMEQAILLQPASFICLYFPFLGSTRRNTQLILYKELRNCRLSSNHKYLLQ